MRFLVPMRAFFLLFIGIIFALGKTVAEEPAGGVSLFPEFRDPRQIFSPEKSNAHLYELLRDGERQTQSRNINDSILILAWQDYSDGKTQYQISGVDGRYAKSEVDEFLEVFFSLDHSEASHDAKLNVIITGNFWGGGHGLESKLSELSKKHRFSVYSAGGWRFPKAVLTKEPTPRLKLIQEAFRQTIGNP